MAAYKKPDPKMPPKPKVPRPRPPANLNMRPEGDFWMTPDGNRVPFDAIKSEDILTLLRALAAGATDCHPDKYARLVAFAAGRSLYARVQDVSERKKMFIRPMEEAGTADDRDVRLVYADWLKEHDLPREEYVQRWLAHFDKVPLHAVLDGTSSLFDDSRTVWIWARPSRINWTDDAAEIENIKDAEGLDEEDEEEGGPPEADNPTLNGRIVRATLPWTLYFGMNRVYRNLPYYAGRKQRLPTALRTALSDTGYTVFESREEAEGALGLTLAALRAELPNLT
jgi:hypothetical protein